MNAPEIIYLQDGEDGELPPEPLDSYEGVTWCADKINDHDTAYILKSEYEKVCAERDAMRAIVRSSQIVMLPAADAPYCHCLQCGKRWPIGSPESHAEDCLCRLI